MTDKHSETTHFGYTEIPLHEKKQRVEEVFRSVAEKYDVMNDVMSLGLHRLWKKWAVAESRVRLGQSVLDVAGGTGDLTKEWAKKTGPTGRVVLADINDAMLQQGRDRLLDLGYTQNIYYVQADAEALPFKKNEFDCISIAFGLRNVTDKMAALRSMFHVLKPGGTLCVLEFSRPTSTLFNTLYDLYSFKAIPKLGKLICQDEASYQYLVESIRMHPDQNTLKNMMIDAGFEEVTYQNASGGIVALHKGHKY